MAGVSTAMGQAAVHDFRSAFIHNDLRAEARCPTSVTVLQPDAPRQREAVTMSESAERIAYRILCRNGNFSRSHLSAASPHLRSRILTDAHKSRPLTMVQAFPSSAFYDWLRPWNWNSISASSAKQRDLEQTLDWEQSRTSLELEKGTEASLASDVQEQLERLRLEESRDENEVANLPGRWASASSSSAFTNLLVNYSLLVSDWWQFKHTAKDRVVNTIMTSPVTQTVGKVAVPVALTVGKLSSPVASTVSKIDIRQAGFFLDRFRKKPGNASLDSEGKLNPQTQDMKDTSTAGDEEVTSVTQDDLDESILWERRKKDVDAERDRGSFSSPGFSFSAAGLLFPYHLGVVQCLMDKNYLKENTPLAGSSAGAIVCAVVAAGLDMQQALIATKALAQDCRENGTAFRLGLVLRKFLETFLPEDAHERCSGRIRVAVTQVFRSPRGLLVDKFDSKEDLINCLITSSFVPGYLAPAPVTWFRDRYCVDGGISLFMPPTATKETVRVCAFPASSFGLSGIAISPDLNPENRATSRQLFSWALEPADDHILDELYKQGYDDTLTWVRQKASSEGPQVVGVLG